MNSYFPETGFGVGVLIVVMLVGYLVVRLGYAVRIINLRSAEEYSVNPTGLDICSRFIFSCLLFFLVSVDVFAGTPVLNSATASGSTITLPYDTSGSNLSSAFVPANLSFAFVRNGGVGGQLTVTSVSINSTTNTVTLGLNGLISLSDTNMTISYTAPVSNYLRDSLGNQLANFSNVFVANAMPVFNANATSLLFNSPSLVSGTGLAVNSKILFSNVITVDGQGIDALVTVASITGATIGGMDTVAGSAVGTITGFTDNWFTLTMTPGSSGGNATINFDFIKSGTYGTTLSASSGQDVILQNIGINSYDLDGAGAGATSFQYQEFGGFATYSVSSATALTQTAFPGYTRFQTTLGGNITNGPGTVQGDSIRVMAFYNAIHSFSIKTGAVASGGLSYFYLDFSKGPNWATVLPPTYQIPTANNKTTNDTTPDLTGTFVGTVGNSTDQAYKLTVTVNGKTYTAGEVVGERTTIVGGVNNGKIQLLDSTSGLRGLFDPVTGIGTWTLTIPPADALPLATYNIGVRVDYGPTLAGINRFTVDTTTNELIINNVVPDTTKPTLTSIERLNPAGEFITPAEITAQNYVDFKVTFSEAVNNIDITDFAITGAGSTGSTLSSVVQSGTNTYTVRITGIPSTNLGVLDLNLLATNNLIDLAGNLLDPTPTPDAEGIVPTSGKDETYTIAGVDYGDAPDTGAGMATGNYRTTLADSGPKHFVGTALKMGSAVTDADTGALQNAAATLDDTTSTDDEDGVASFNTITTATAGYSVTVTTANSTGSTTTLHGWIDFNKNGNFETGEYASAAVANGATSATLNWSGISGLTTGDTYVRLRIASTGLSNASGNTGTAGDGEIEDYRLTIVAAPFDYGDAPSGISIESVARNYGSASHTTTTTTVYLGTTAPDTDTAANQTTWQAQTTANGDDTTPASPSDEGIAQLLSGAPAAFPVLTSAATSYSLALVCRGTLTANAVSGWIDFNKNGTFDVGEGAQGTCSSGTSTAGTVTLTWNSLTGLKTGSTFARFRVASNATESGAATGTAADGEVEDYPLTIRTAVKIIKTLSPTTDAGKFNLQVINGNPVGGTNPATDVVNNGTTNFVAVDAGTSITVQETAGTSTSLTNYTSTLSCTQGDGATAITPAPTTTLTGATRTGVFTSPALGSVGTAAQVICTFTNTKLPTVAVTKISNGGIGTFTFTGTNGWSSQNISTVTSGVGVTGATQTLTAAGVSTDLTESVPPVGYTLTGVSCSGLGSGGTATFNSVTRTVTLDAAATAAGSAITCTFTNAKAVTVKVQKITQGGFDGPFSFTQTNLVSAPASITTMAANTATPALPTAINVITSGTAVTLTETPAFGYTLTSASCTDANSLVTGNTGGFGSLLGNVLTISPTNVVSGADITCIFTNTKNVASTISGNVFKDSGTSGGTANNRIRDGAETGIAGVTVKLTDCSGTTYSTAITDGAGNYNLAASSAPAGTVCVEESNLSSYISTGSNVAGSTSPVGYTLVTADKISFILVASTSYTGLNFGDVPANQFITDGAKTGIAGSTLIYPHTFIAGTGGSVTFSLPGATASPVIPDWKELLYIDTDCNALLDGSESSSVLLPVAMTVVEGQTICLIQKEFIPASAPQGASNHVPVQALFAYTGSTVPNATYTRQDITTVSSNALFLMKEVRNVTTPTSPVWKTSNTAKSGEILEYRITYTNNGAETIKNLQINDATPSFTTFVSGLCETAVVATPASLGLCSLTKTLAPNNTGGLKWTFTPTLAAPVSQLQSGGSGFVTYQVKVD